MIQIKLKLIEPLHLAASHTVSPTASTLEFIPGTALRGALAKKYLDQKGCVAEDENFQNWFLKEGVRFGSLTPLGNSLSYKLASEPLPLTAFTCKLYPGFRSDDFANHGVRDMLFEFMKGEDDFPDDRCYHENCESHLVPFNGFYFSDSSYGKISIYKRLETRTAIDSMTETAAQRQLYSLEVLEEGQIFGGSIELETREQELAFKAMLLGDDAEIRLGAARTRGFGLAKIFEAKLSGPADKMLENLSERIKNFNDHALHTRSIGCKGNSLCFALTLRSDCILVDEYLRCQGIVTPQALGFYVHPALAQATPLAAFCRTRLVDGWNAAQKNPRPTEAAICSGSVFVFGINASPEELAGYLVNLEKYGMGERRQEGYGRVTVCDPFHLQEGQR